MRSPLIRRLALPCVLALACSVAAAGMVSKQFKFKEGVTLEIGEATDDGLRLDSVQFALPTNSFSPRASSSVRVSVAVSTSPSSSAAT